MTFVIGMPAITSRLLRPKRLTKAATRHSSASTTTFARRSIGFSTAPHSATAKLPSSACGWQTSSVGFGTATAISKTV